MEFRADIMDEESLRRSLVRISHQILEKNEGTDNLCLVGIKTRGIPLAEIIRENIKKIEGRDIPVGELDISLYRDDLSEISINPTVKDSELPFSVTGKTIVLVDDVIYTGRTARAAIDCLLSHGRPSFIQLAVAVDRGHRELPIRPDFVCKNVPTSKDELISVKIPPIDNEYGVKLYRR